jgi:hypothetical protein
MLGFLREIPMNERSSSSSSDGGGGGKHSSGGATDGSGQAGAGARC